MRDLWECDSQCAYWYHRCNLFIVLGSLCCFSVAVDYLTLPLKLNTDDGQIKLHQITFIFWLRQRAVLTLRWRLKNWKWTFVEQTAPPCGGQKMKTGVWCFVWSSSQKCVCDLMWAVDKLQKRRYINGYIYMVYNRNSGGYIHLFRLKC